MSARFTFNVCHDGEWELREGDVVMAKCESRAAVLNLARSLAETARMLGQKADVEEIGPCPPAGRDLTLQDGPA